MTRFEAGMLMNKIAMLLDDDAFQMCKGELKELENGICDLFDKVDNAYEKGIDDVVDLTKTIDFRQGCIQSKLPLYEYLENEAEKLKAGEKNG